MAEKSDCNSNRSHFIDAYHSGSILCSKNLQQMRRYSDWPEKENKEKSV